MLEDDWRVFVESETPWEGLQDTLSGSPSISDLMPRLLHSVQHKVSVCSTEGHKMAAIDRFEGMRIPLTGGRLNMCMTIDVCMLVV